MPSNAMEARVCKKQGKGQRKPRACFHPVPLSSELLHLDITYVAKTTVTSHSLV